MKKLIENLKAKRRERIDSKIKKWDEIKELCDETKKDMEDFEENLLDRTNRKELREFRFNKTTLKMFDGLAKLNLKSLKRRQKRLG